MLWAVAPSSGLHAREEPTASQRMLFSQGESKDIPMIQEYEYASNAFCWAFNWPILPASLALRDSGKLDFFVGDVQERGISTKTHSTHLIGISFPRGEPTVLPAPRSAKFVHILSRGFNKRFSGISPVVQCFTLGRANCFTTRIPADGYSERNDIFILKHNN